MANIEGNEIALRSVFGQNLPAPRDGSDAKTDNDNRPPFFSSDYTLAPSYSDNLAPSWVYGLTYEGAATNKGQFQPFVESDYGPIYVSFGNVTAAGAGNAETILYPGQTIRFPRASRRVFIRASQTSGNAYIKLTWQLDPYADKHSSIASPLEVEGWEGRGFAPTIYDVAALPVYVYPRTQLFVYVQNNTLVDVNYYLYWNPPGNPLSPLEIDRELTIPAGAQRMFFYGPGVVQPAPLAAFQRMHAVALPGPYLQVQAAPVAPIGAGENVKIGVWYR